MHFWVAECREIRRLGVVVAHRRVLVPVRWIGRETWVGGMKGPEPPGYPVDLQGCGTGYSSKVLRSLLRGYVSTHGQDEGLYEIR